MAWNPAVVGVGGAAASTAVPWLGLASTAASLFGASKKQDSPAGPSMALSDPEFGQEIDFSNWTVATSGSKAKGGKSGGFEPPAWLVLAGLGLAAVVAVRWIAKKHG